MSEANSLAKRSTIYLCGIAAEPDFQRSLRLERLRTDRSGQPFTLLVFYVQMDEACLRKTRIFIEGLHRRIRAIDQIGWFGPNQVAVLLASSDQEGAQKFIRSLKSNGTGARAFPPCAAYPYSRDWPKGAFSGAETELPPWQRRFQPHADDPLNSAIAQPIPRWKR